MAYSTRCLKFAVLSFTIIFAVTGVAVAIFSIANLVHFYTHRNFVPNNVSSPVLLLALTGVAACMVAALGWYGVMADNTCRLSAFSALLLITVIVEFGGAIWSLTSRADFLDHMTIAMQNSFRSYAQDETVVKKWDSLQQELECCGTDGPEDYRPLGAVSWACCASETQHHGSCALMRQRGCLPALELDVRERLLRVSLFSMAAALIQISGVFCSCCLSNSVKNEARRNKIRTRTSGSIKT